MSLAQCELLSALGKLELSRFSMVVFEEFLRVSSGGILA